MSKKMSLILVLILGVAGCASENKRTAMGAGLGAAAGGVLGAVVGHQSGNRAAGAMVGAALGAGMGGMIGHRMDKQAKELAQIAETKRTDQGLVTKLKSDILFDSGKSDLKPAAKENLLKMAKIMKKYPENVLTIKGYTDSTGTKAINEKLSLERADAVRGQLISAGMPQATISTLGEGPASPIADNSTQAGRSQNRRVEIEITVDESKVPKKGKS